MKTKEQILNEVRAVEDGLTVLIERFGNGTIDNRAVLYALKELWLRLKKLSDLDNKADGAV